MNMKITFKHDYLINKLIVWDSLNYDLKDKWHMYEIFK